MRQFFSKIMNSLPYHFDMQRPCPSNLYCMWFIPIPTHWFHLIQINQWMDKWHPNWYIAMCNAMHAPSCWLQLDSAIWNHISDTWHFDSSPNYVIDVIMQSARWSHSCQIVKCVVYMLQFKLNGHHFFPLLCFSIVTKYCWRQYLLS